MNHMNPLFLPRRQLMHTPLQELGIHIFERGWLSSNNVLLLDSTKGHVVDTGYSSHSEQTVCLVHGALAGRPLNSILNTHLHSDHCGGNAALKVAYPDVEILIPPGQAAAVSAWDVDALTYRPTGQQCPRFRHDELLVPGAEVILAGHPWEIHAAPGHDPHAVLLYQATHRVLISGDALWENGFGVVFPELEGCDAFSDVASTIDVIEQLEPSLVIPGHGPAFTDVAASIARARSRLDQFQQQPSRHAEYAAKVLVKFRLLEVQQTSLEALEQWFQSTRYFELVQRTCPEIELTLNRLVQRLVTAGAAKINGDMIIDA